LPWWKKKKLYYSANLFREVRILNIYAGRGKKKKKNGGGGKEIR